MHFFHFLLHLAFHTYLNKHTFTSTINNSFWLSASFILLAFFFSNAYLPTHNKKHALWLGTEVSTSVVSQVKQDHLHSLSGSFLLPGWDVNFSFSQRGKTTDVHHSLFRISAAWSAIIFHVNFQNNKTWITHGLSYSLYSLFKQQSNCTLYLNTLVMCVKVNSIFFKLLFKIPLVLRGNIYEMLKVVISGFSWRDEHFLLHIFSYFLM